MYKALITDLDGTAVPISSDGSDVDEITRQSIKKAQEAGYQIACATGRNGDSINSVLHALGITGPCIIGGGSAIIDPQTDEILWEQHLTPGTTHDILAIFKRHATGGNLHIPGDPHIIPINEVDSVSDTVRYMYMIGVSDDEAKAIKDDVNKAGYAVAHNTPSWSGPGYTDVHVTHPRATKEHALKIWHKMQGIEAAETIGMGDSGNDLPLFQASGLKVAVGNATDELKAIADYIAPDVTDHALAHVIKKFLLSQ